MDWNSIGVGALSGALAGGIGAALAFALVKDRTRAGILSAVLAVILYGVFSRLADDYLVSPPDTDQLFAEMSSELELIRKIESADPVLLDDIKARFAEDLESGASHEEAGYNVGKRAADYAITRLPGADDQTVAAFLAVTNESLDQLIEQDPELCFRYLFPHVAGGIDTKRHLSADVNERHLSLLANAIDTYDEGRVMPTSEEFQTLMAPVAEDVVETYGQAAVAGLAAPQAESTDHAQTCLIARGLYGNIAELPGPDAVTLLRAMLAQ